MQKHPDPLATATDLLAQNRLEQAEGVCRQILASEPENAEALYLLGWIFHRQKRFAEAIESFGRAIVLRPMVADFHRTLAEAHWASQNLDEAHLGYKEALRLNPRDAASQNGLGRVLANQGDHAAAILHYEEALRLDPHSAEAENNLGAALRPVDRLEDAVEHYQNALRLQPDFFPARHNLGNFFKATGKTEAAVAEYQHALRLQPKNPFTLNNLGDVLLDLKQFEAAAAQFEEALRIKPDYALAYANLGELVLQERYEFSKQQIEHIKKLLQDGKIKAEHACTLSLTLGGTLHKRGCYDEAYFYYDQGNAIKQRTLEANGKSFVAKDHRRKIDANIALFGKEFFERMGSSGVDTETPIFVVGMPRSSTTLVEQIIAGHPEAAGAGELKEIPLFADQLPDLLKSSDHFPRCLLNADQNVLGAFAQRHLDRLHDIGNGSRRVVDKQTTNDVYLGLIAMLYPNARVIHCQRDAMDACLSCYLRHLEDMNWAWRLQDIGFYYREHQRIMAHWREVLPLRMLEVCYEDLVADQEGVSRKLIEFCGLDWSDRCLEFHKNTQAVHTASRIQVRQPIFTSSTGRWKNYESHLEPLRRALEGSDGP